MSTRHNRALDEVVEEPTAHAEDSGSDASKMVIRVRRGALRRFDHLKTKSASLPVEIKWDRRASDRRGATTGSNQDRRRAERRQAPPFTWETADFVVVGEPNATAVPAKTDAPAATTRKVARKR